MVVLETTLGEITIEVFPEEAPGTVESFLQYVDDGFYDGTVFHRVVPGFVLQGGGLTEDMTKKPTCDPITNEADNGLKNVRGALSMARTSDIHSATSQFFINLVDNPFLDHGDGDFGYAVFAKVAEGMDVVDQIAGVETGTVEGYSGSNERPCGPVRHASAPPRAWMAMAVSTSSLAAWSLMVPAPRMPVPRPHSYQMVILVWASVTASRS